MYITSRSFDNRQYSNSSLQTLQVYLLKMYVFSRYAYFVPLRSKSGDKAARALESIFETDFYRKIQTEWVREFVNRHTKKILLKANIILFHSNSSIRQHWLNS